MPCVWRPAAQMLPLSGFCGDRAHIESWPFGRAGVFRHVLRTAGATAGAATLFERKIITTTGRAPALRRLAVVEVACGAGAPDPGCEDGPAAFRRIAGAGFCDRLVMPAWQAMPRGPRADETPLQTVARAARWTAGTTRRLVAGRERFLVVGGDHSCAIGTWSGAADALRASGPLGLIWIDAHLDMHVPETTHSGALHGMPVACLLGHGAAELTAVAGRRPALDPRHVCLVGARSYEPEEMAFAERHGVRVIAMPELHRRGLAAVLAEARSVAGTGTAAYGVSLDLDAFDPADAPGVGTPAAGGIRAADFFASWASLVRHPACVGVEIVEFNPARDRAGRTAALLRDLAEGFACASDDGTGSG